jgi:FlgD Ig-like domain
VARAPAVVVLVLLAATALAFVRTQQQKLERGPIGRVEIDRVFSPVCGCETDDASIGLRLRRAETVTLEIVNENHERVRTLVRRERYEAGDQAWSWDGRDEGGRLLPDGAYRPRLTLASGARTFVLPNPIKLDTTAPRVTRIAIRPSRFSPDGDGRRDRVTVRYAVSEPAQALLSVNGRQVERTRFRPLEGTRSWNGKRRGKGLPAGRYEVALAAEDAAGNVGAATSPTAVTIRYVELVPPLVRVRAGRRFGVRVRADARSFRWRFARGTGVARPGLLVLRAPRAAGRYTLFVSAHGHGDRARVLVRPRPRRLARSGPPGGT